MKAVIQLVSRASVAVDNQVIGEVSHGLMVLLGVAEGDSKTGRADGRQDSNAPYFS